MPELVRRSTWLATEHGRLILSGHSQGSVFVMAAVLQMQRRATNHTAVVTTGSPLGRLYSRLFPAFFSARGFDDTAERLTEPDGHIRWINLWRHTDPIGGPVKVDAVDRRLLDPAAFGSTPGDTTYAPISGHSMYPAEPAYTEAIVQLRRLLGQGVADEDVERRERR